MSFFGKEYKYESEENFGDFLKAVGLPDEEIAKFLQFKPVSKIEQDGDEYVYTTVSPAGTKVTKFKSGVEFEDVIKEGFPIKTTYTVDGNKVTQEINTEKGNATFVREFSDDALVVTITADKWDGTAKRFYKA
ncbi:fatty acid-binding protein 1-like [Anticarsia gemmatalis]|uniref:fatty acid-binding protein 1-like n=1 Tax=Anticarsia gemmatalis TaxID=129554 RepID=UPI003F7782B3